MEPLKEQVYNHVRNMITTNQLSYQEIYSETKLAAQLEVSRTPFRDAIHRLSQEGLVDIIPNKGFQLHQLTIQDVNETFQVRSALESYCTLQITKEFKSNKARLLFGELEEIMKKLEEIMLTTHSIEIFCEYDFQFHIKIIEYLDNKIFNQTFQSFMCKMQRLAVLSLLHKNRMENTYAEHLDILSAMKSGNTSDIYEITLIHMNRPKDINLEDLTIL